MKAGTCHGRRICFLSQVASSMSALAACWQRAAQLARGRVAGPGGRSSLEQPRLKAADGILHPVSTVALPEVRGEVAKRFRL